MDRGSSKWFDRHNSEEVCPWNHKFASDASEPALVPIEALATPDARALARSVLAMSAEQYSSRYRHSPLSRATLAGLKRNAAAVLGNAGTIPDPVMLERLQYALS